MFIRQFQQTDTQAVIQLWQSCGLTAPQNNPNRDIARKLQVDPELFLVGVDSRERIVGSIMGGYEGHRGWLNYLAVHPDHRMNGYGRALVKTIEKMLEERGAPKINLQVRSSNHDTLRFYEALGYRLDDVVSMGKRLIYD